MPTFDMFIILIIIFWYYYSHYYIIICKETTLLYNYITRLKKNKPVFLIMNKDSGINLFIFMDKWMNSIRSFLWKGLIHNGTLKSKLCIINNKIFMISLKKNGYFRLWFLMRFSFVFYTISITIKNAKIGNCDDEFLA